MSDQKFDLGAVKNETEYGPARCFCGTYVQRDKEGRLAEHRRANNLAEPWCEGGNQVMHTINDEVRKHKLASNVVIQNNTVTTTTTTSGQAWEGAILNPSNPFEKALIDMVQTHRKKSADYGSNSDPYDNFIESSNQVEDVPGKSCEVLIATKQSRLKHLLFKKDKKPANEAIEDSLLDRAVYSVIAMVLYARGDYDPR